MGKLRAKISPDGKIKSIGYGNDLPYTLPNGIDFTNYKYYTCINMDDVSNISSWTDEPVIVVDVIEETVIHKDSDTVKKPKNTRYIYQVFLLLIIVVSTIHSLNIAISGDSFNGITGLLFSFCLVVLLLFDIFTSRN